jgi:hypothetical protein
MDVIATDYKGPLSGHTLVQGNNGFVLFVELFSSFGWVYPVKSKMESLAAFKLVQARSERWTEKPLKALRSDQGTEVVNTAYRQYLESQGIQQQLTSAYSQQSDGRVESRINILNRMANSMLVNAGLSKEFYELAFVCANHIYNRSATTRTGGKTPLEMISGKKPRIDYLRVFGCKAFYFLFKEQRSTDNLPAKVGRFVGYSQNGLMYRIWNGSKAIETRHVAFDENCFDFSLGSLCHHKQTPGHLLPHSV